jgi:hypothetical protein
MCGNFSRTAPLSLKKIMQQHVGLHRRAADHRRGPGDRPQERHVIMQAPKNAFGRTEVIVSGAQIRLSRFIQRRTRFVYAFSCLKRRDFALLV